MEVSTLWISRLMFVEPTIAWKLKKTSAKMSAALIPGVPLCPGLWKSRCPAESLASMHTQACPTLCDPMDCSPPGSSVHVISQARILEWAALTSSLPFSRGCLGLSSLCSQSCSCPN